MSKYTQQQTFSSETAEKLLKAASARGITQMEEATRDISVRSILHCCILAGASPDFELKDRMGWKGLTAALFLYRQGEEVSSSAEGLSPLEGDIFKKLVRLEFDVESFQLVAGMFTRDEGKRARKGKDSSK